MLTEFLEPLLVYFKVFFRPNIDLHNRLITLTQIEERIIHLDITNILDFSDTLRILYIQIQNEGIEAVGGSEKNPLPIPDVTVEEVTAFLLWVCRRTWSTQLTVDEILKIMPIAHVWKAAEVMEHCFQQLSSNNLHQSPAFILSLSIKYSHPTTLESSVRQLAFTPLNRSLQLECLSFPVFLLIAKARDAVAMTRAALGAYVPSIAKMPKCRNHNYCTEEWGRLWSKHITASLGLKDHIRLKDLRLPFVETLEACTLFEKCAQHMIREFTDHTAWITRFNQEEEIINGTIQALTALNDLNMNAEHNTIIE